MSDDIVKTLREGPLKEGEQHGIELFDVPTAQADMAFAADEIERLRKVVCIYGDRIRMANAADPALQQSIDDAFTYSET